MLANPTTLAYLAGVIDSDGYISAGTTTGGRYPWFGAQVGIAGTRREPHDLAASVFGGNVGVYIPRRDRVSHRPQFQWQRAGRQATPVIEAVLPYLMVKQGQAALALELQATADEERLMRGLDDPYPWFGPDYDPGEHLAYLFAEVRILNLRGVRQEVSSER